MSELHLEHSEGGEGSDGDGGARVLPCARRSLRIAKDGAGGGELPRYLKILGKVNII